MEKTLERRARTKIRQLRETTKDAGLLLEELAVVLGADVDNLARHLGKGKISGSRARQYAAIVNVSVTESAVHLVVARKQRRRGRLSPAEMAAEKRRAAELLDQGRNRSRQA